MTAEDSRDGCARAGVPDVSNRFLLKWMFGFLRPVKGLTVLACLYLAMRIGAEIVAVRETAEAVNLIKVVQFRTESPDQSFRSWIRSADPGSAQLRRTVLLLAGITAVLGVLTYLREVTNTKLSMHMVFYIREAVYDKLQHAGFAFHDRLSTGELINRSLGDLQSVRAFINSAVLITLEIVLIVAGYIALLLTRSPWVALLALVPMPIWTVYILRFSRKAQPLVRAAVEAGDRNVSLIAENLAGVHVVKAFAAEPYEIRKYDRSCDEFFERVIARIRAFANFTPVIRGIATASHLSLFLLAAILMLRHRLAPGDILMLGSAMGAILGRLQQVSVINDQYQNAIVSARRLYEILSAPPSVVERPGARPLPPGPGSVRFEGVTFGYDPDRPVLRDVSFEVPGGKVVAIVGPTGAGKTTLVYLIGRFYDPQKGRILIDGTDIRDVTLASIRTETAFVFQETYLFSDSVEANIAYGRPGIRGTEVEAVSELAQAHEFVSALPRGYGTVLADRGSNLSGGQRQRLAIARALMSNPRILVLDDATAAVDPETEDFIRRGLHLVLYDRTIFIIAHRISTVRQADLVLVLENGRITQMGTHDQLMAEGGHYREIAAAQLLGDGAGESPSWRRVSHDRFAEPAGVAHEGDGRRALGEIA